MSTTIDSLDIKIQSNAKAAAKGLDKLVASLTALKKVSSVNDDLGKLSESINKVKNSTNGLANVGKQGSKSIETMGQKALSFAKKTGVALLGVNSLSNGFADWIDASTEYQESLNLFTASLGEYAEEAKEYAEQVSEVMGIDPAEWMRGQGIFNTLITGFGVAGDKAAFMSKNLMQLAYDLSSFYNLPVEETIQKLKSGIAGELEPLRSLGYDLSQAKLESLAMSYGIDQSVSSMTQAGKSLLRYQAIMTQVTQVQGDMSRTLAAPANQLRILQAAANQAARALGNMFIPALNAILPAAIALLNVIRTVANAIANLFGFQLTDVDYSGLGGAADAAGNIEESLGGGAGSAKKMRDYLMGIDELNVIKDPAESGGGGGGGGSLGDLTNMELTGYDFLGDALSEKISAIQEKIEAFIPTLKNIFEIVWDLKELILAGVALAAIVKLWNKAKAVWAWFLGIKFVDRFIDGFYLIHAVGGNVFQSLRGGLDNIRMGLTKAQRATVGIVSALLEFAVVKTVFKQLTLGTKKLGVGIAELVVVIGTASAALYVALGPIGLVVSGLVALTAAAFGYADANKEMIREMVNNSVFDDTGSSLEALAVQLEIVTDKYKANNEEVIRLSESVEKGREEIERIKTSLDIMTMSLGLSGEVTAEEVDAIKGEFSALCSAIRDNMTDSANVILTSLAGALEQAVPEVQGHIQTLIGEYQLFVRETQGRAGEIEIEANRIYDSLVGMVPGSGEYTDAMNALNELYTELGYLQGGMSDAEWQWGQTVEAFNITDVNWGSVDDAKAMIEEIGQSGAEALDAVAAARDAALKAIDEDIQYASKYGSAEDVQMLFDVRETLEANYAAQEAAIQGELTTIFTSITDALALEANTQAENAKAEFENLDWFGQFWNGSAENYAAQAIEAFNNDIYTPISEQIASSAESLGIASETIGISTLDGIMNGVESSWTSRSIPEQMNNYGLDALTGFANGILENQQVATDASATASEAALTAFADAQQSHSPSLLYAEQGMFAMQGAAQGVTENAHLLAEALANVSTESATVFGENYANDLMSGIERGMEGTMTTATTSFSRYVSSAVSELAKIKDEFGNIVTEAKTMATNVNAEIAKIKSPTISINFTTNISSVASTIRSTLNSIGNSANYEFSVRRMAEGGIISALASGGIIPAAAGGGGFNTGQLFIAREAGPELVAGIGRGRTAVMNNDQIVESVSNGVYRAVVDAMSTQGQSDSGDIVLMLGDKEVYRAAKRGEKASGYTLTANPSFA